MNAEELAEQIDEIKRLTPMPGDFIVIRLKHSVDKQTTQGLVRMLRDIFPVEQRILVVDRNMNIETHYGTCLHCGHQINPNGV